LLPSGKKININSKELATFGENSNKNHYLNFFYKAGQKRLLNKRPKVRGVAMNPIDHPHGGGQGKTAGGRVSVTP
jgi:large subunit ribosomal protein L2